MPGEKLKLRLGADPEFEIRNSKGTFVNAGSIISDSYHDRPFGLDAHSATGEIRVTPGTPKQIVKDINKILESAVRSIGNYGIYGGAMKRESLGGHIHFSGIPHDYEFIRSLDRFITHPLRKVSNYRRRERGHYGSDGQYRDQPHGWEYRSPCSWLSHPKIALGILQIAYVCAKRYMGSKLPRMFSNKEEMLSYSPTREREDIEEFYNIIERMEKSKLKLEEVEIFQAWRKRPKDQIKQKNKVHFDFKETDFNLDVIGHKFNRKKEYGMDGIELEKRFQIVGARVSRTYRDTIFVPHEILDRLPTRIAKIKIIGWGLPTIGISYSLREKIDKTIEVLYYIKWYLKREEKNVLNIIEGVV